MSKLYINNLLMGEASSGNLKLFQHYINEYDESRKENIEIFKNKNKEFFSSRPEISYKDIIQSYDTFNEDTQLDLVNIVKTALNNSNISIIEYIISENIPETVDVQMDKQFLNILNIFYDLIANSEDEAIKIYDKLFGINYREPYNHLTIVEVLLQKINNAKIIEQINDPNTREQSLSFVRKIIKIIEGIIDLYNYDILSTLYNENYLQSFIWKMNRYDPLTLNKPWFEEYQDILAQFFNKSISMGVTIGRDYRHIRRKGYLYLADRVNI